MFYKRLNFKKLSKLCLTFGVTLAKRYNMRSLVHLHTHHIIVVTVTGALNEIYGNDIHCDVYHKAITREYCMLW